MAAELVQDPSLIFDGSKAVLSDNWVRAIRTRVFNMKIIKDDERCAEVAAACLGGEALVWYEAQSEEIQTSWKLLRREILLRWPSWPDWYNESKSAHGAPPPETPSANETDGLVADVAALSLASYGKHGPPVGRIRVLSAPGTFLGYVSLGHNGCGLHQVVMDVAKAAIVSLLPSERLYKIQIVGPEVDASVKPVLGMTWGWKVTHWKPLPKALAGEDLTWGGMATLFRSPKTGNIETSSRHFTGVSGSDMWSVSKDNVINPSWEVKPGLRRDLFGVMGNTGKTLSLTNDFQSYIREDTNPSDWTQVKFIFEPLN